MKDPRTLGLSTVIASLVLLIFSLNVKAYRSAPDPVLGHRGVVFIMPSFDKCVGMEIEDTTHHIDFFGGKCE